MADRLYSGRGFALALSVAKEQPFYVVSAGLGLVERTTLIPSYGLTVASGSPDSILSRITDRANPIEWWKIGAAKSPFHTSIDVALRDWKGELFLAALPKAYALMIEEELHVILHKTDGRLRLFTSSIEELQPDLQAVAMPYDSRLDGPDSPIRGPRSDSAQRALAHFTRHILLPSSDPRSAEEHAAAVREALQEYRLPTGRSGKRASDDVIRSLIEQSWTISDGQASKMLHHFRHHLNVACEQKRFIGLFREAASRRQETKS